MKRRNILQVLLAFVLVFALVACGNKEEKPAENDTEVTDTEDENVDTEDDTGAALDEDQYLNVALGAEPESLDPQKGSDAYGDDLIANIFEPLIRMKQEGDELVIDYAGAESMDISEDGLVYTFKIRDFEWEDGEKVTAEHYEYGIKRSVDPETGSESAFLLEPIENFTAVNSGEMDVDELGVKALDENTLEITLGYPASYFQTLIPTRVMMPQRPDIIEEFGEAYGAEAENMVACGPFRLEAWVHNSELNIVKNENYWDADSVKLDRVNYLIRQDLTTAMQSLEAGETDMGNTQDKEWQGRLEDVDGLSYNVIERTLVDYIPMNLEDEIMSNEKVRQAISVALDREMINEQLFDGMQKPAKGWVVSSMNVLGENYESLRDHDPLTVLKEEVGDPKAHLEEGLKELGYDSVDDVTINFIITGGDVNQSYAELIQANLRDTLGLNMEIETMEWPVLSNRITSGDYQIAYLAWSAHYDDPYSVLSLFHSSAGAINTGWTSEEFDAKIAEAASKLDPKEAADLYYEAEQMLINGASVAPVLNYTTNAYQYDYVKNRSTLNFDKTGYKYMYTEGRE